MSERFLKWAEKRYLKSLGYSVRIAGISLGNCEIDGGDVREGEKIAIEKLKQKAASRKA